jgi:hypothetical protein
MAGRQLLDPGASRLGRHAPTARAGTDLSGGVVAGAAVLPLPGEGPRPRERPREEHRDEEHAEPQAGRVAATFRHCANMFVLPGRRHRGTHQSAVWGRAAPNGRASEPPPGRPSP